VEGTIGLGSSGSIGRILGVKTQQRLHGVDGYEENESRDTQQAEQLSQSRRLVGAPDDPPQVVAQGKGDQDSDTGNDSGVDSASGHPM
jgi:mevalonate kinase